MELDAPSEHALRARMLARTRKRPRTTSQVDALGRKRKTFVTDDKGAVVLTGFQNEILPPKAVYPKTTDASHASSEQHIHGSNLTCILDTGSEVNLLGRKHPKDF